MACFILSFQLASADCVNITIPKTVYFPGETFQAEISGNFSQDLAYSNIYFFKDGVERPLFFNLTTISKGKYFVYAELPSSQADIGSWSFEIQNALCTENKILKSITSQANFSIIKSLSDSYSWLTNQTKTQWPSSTDENSLVLLALADDANSASKGRDALLAKSTNSECWPVQSGGCSIKSTAMALLALDAFGEDTSTIQSWLVARKKSFAEGVSWYMQLDTSENAKCKISYDGKNYNVSVGKDKKVSSSAGTCLSLAQNNYWLKVSSGSCLDKTFTVNCDKDFKVSFIYTKNSVLYVSSQIFDGASGQSVDAAIKSYCLGFTSCDYEGTLWAAYALQQAGNNYFSMLLPYLAGQSDLDVNAKYLPNTFLFALTSSTNYGEQVLQS